MQETLAHVRCSLRRMDLKRPVLLRILVCIVAFFILFDLSFVGAWARDPSEAAFKITKALNIELFLNLLQTQGTAQPATTAYNLNPDNYRPQAPRDIKAAGFDAVRLAVEPVPLLKMNEAERHIIYRTFATYIDGYLAAGLNVIFDIHVTGRDPIWNLNTLATSTSDAKFKSYTETVVSVARFLGAYNPQHVALELFNEPPCISAARWSELQKTLYNVARAVVPNHTLVLTGPCWSSMDELQKIDVNEYDKNTIYTFHFYQPTLFTFQGIPWLEGGFKFLRRLPYPPTTNLSAAFISAIMADVKSAPGLDGSNKAKIVNYLTREIWQYFGTPMNCDWLNGRVFAIQNWAKLKKISPRRILVGEFGAGRDIDGYLGPASEDRMLWLRDARTSFEAAGFPWAVWSDCCAFGILTGATGPFDPVALKSLGLQDPGRTTPERESK